MVTSVAKQQKQQVSTESLKNLKPRWKQGESGNPKGRTPKPSCLTSWLKEDLARIDPVTGKTNAQLIAEKMVTDAKAGVASARAEIFERVEGKVTIPVSVEDKQKTVEEMTDAELEAIARGSGKQGNTPPPSTP